MEELDPVQNVIVFGESGVGKSSIINLIVDSEVAKTSPDATACTVRTRSYDTTIRGKKYKLWDTPGLDGGSFGIFRAAIAERNLKRFLRNHLKKDEPSLLIYCVRGSRATRALVRHYQSVRSAIQERKGSIAMVIVVTGLEHSRGDMESWWHRNAVDLASHDMEFIDHACITSIDDDSRDPVLVRSRRTHSRDAVRNLIMNNSVPRKLNENVTQRPRVTRQEDNIKWTDVAWAYLVSTLILGRRRSH